MPFAVTVKVAVVPIYELVLVGCAVMLGATAGGAARLRHSYKLLVTMAAWSGNLHRRRTGVFPMGVHATQGRFRPHLLNGRYLVEF